LLPFSLFACAEPQQSDRAADETAADSIDSSIRRGISDGADTPRASVWDRAWESGVDFRAVGQEPGWLLEIFEGERIRFAYDYGQHEVEAPAPEPAVDEQARRTIYDAANEDHDLTIIITMEPCQDVMSGESFDEFDGTTYSGCGREL
jgi:uncharacterized membrane protein